MRARIKAIRARFAKWRKAKLEALHERFAKHRKETQEKVAAVKAAHDEPFHMYDSIDLDEIPTDAEAVAGYVNGNWPTFGLLKKHWPHAKHLSIAVTSAADADCLDVEPGDATPADAPAWIKRQRKRGLKKPVVYCSLSAAAGVLAELRGAGIGRDEIRLWTAHYGQGPHICGPDCGFGLSTKADATQFTDRSGGRNLDESLCRPGFLDND